MQRPEQLELEAHRAHLEADVKRLVEKYLAIFEWDVPEVDEPLSRRLIIAALKQALDRVEQALPAVPEFQFSRSEMATEGHRHEGLPGPSR